MDSERSPKDNENAIDDVRVQHHSYFFSDGEALPYALFVPSTYKPRCTIAINDIPAWIDQNIRLVDGVRRLSGSCGA